MCQDVPVRTSPGLAALLILWLLASLAAFAQPAGPGRATLRPDWRRIGNSSIDFLLASPATGQVDRVWFSDDGSRLFIRTGSGRYFESQDFENWSPRSGLTTPDEDLSLTWSAPTPPEILARFRAGAGLLGRLYAFGRHVYRSEDGGRHWSNLTSLRGESIIGEGILDLAVSPADPDVIVAVNRYGVWRSVDGGLSWCGLNDSLPNLPVRRLLETPTGSHGTRVLLADGAATEWAPGEKRSWRLVDDAAASRREGARGEAGIQLGVEVTAMAWGGDYSYAGSADGRLWVSSDQGRTWRWSRLASGGPVEALYAIPERPGTAFAALAESAGEGDRARVLRTLDGGLRWEDLTGDLPAGSARGVTADRTGGAVYVATGRGVFVSRLDPAAPSPQAHWLAMSENLPPVPAMDVGLDEAGNQLYVALDGYGVYAAPAPHRFWNVEVVNAADFSRRPAAPGSLLTVLGGRLLRAQAGLIEAPVLHASDMESQIQVPFEVTGSSALLSLQLSKGWFTMSVPLQEVSPAIFVDPDGSALLLDADSGVLLDGATPAHSGGRVQILATGLGKVRPAWRTGIAAPLQEPPRVIAPVGAYLDRTPVEVTRATLAPGYVGFYLVEVRLPSLVDAGPAELFVVVDGHESNRVRVYLEP
jgi:uncharacterized protein (TIGR03437 family)